MRKSCCESQSSADICSLSCIRDKIFYYCVSNQMLKKQNMMLLLNGTGDIVKMDTA